MGGVRFSSSTWTTALIAIAIALATFAAFCAWLFLDVGALRDSIDRNVAALAAVADVSTALNTDRSLEQPLERLDQRLRGTADRELLTTARARLDEVEGSGPPALVETLVRIRRDLRQRNQELASTLELRWRMLSVVAFGAFAFAAVALLLTVVARRQSYELVRATRERDRELRRRFNERTEALVAVARGLAHEINNPLAFVTSNVTHLQYELDEKEAVDADLRQVFAETKEGLDRIRKVISELQAATRGTPGERAADVRRAIESSAWILRHFIAPRAALEVQLEDVPGAAISGAELSMAITQLVTAIVDPLPENPTNPPVIRIRTVPDGGRARVEIAIPAKVLPAPAEALLSPTAAGAEELQAARFAATLLERAGAELRIDASQANEVVLALTLSERQPSTEKR